MEKAFRGVGMGDKSRRLLSEVGSKGMPGQDIQLLLRVDPGEHAGARRWDMAWVGTLDPTPHKDLGSSEAV